MTGQEQATLNRVWEKLGAIDSKVDAIGDTMQGIDTRVRTVEDAAIADKAVAHRLAQMTEKSTITKRWVVQVVVTGIGVTAGVVFGIVGVLTQ